MNPIDMLKVIMNKNKNPKDIIKNVMLKGNSNPMITNLIDMAEKGNNKGVEQFARNIFKEKGKDFDKEFEDFMNQIR